MAETIAPIPPRMVEPLYLGVNEGLVAKLQYWKFGLRYVLRLKIPWVPNQGDQASESGALDLTESGLSVFIMKGALSN